MEIGHDQPQFRDARGEKFNWCPVTSIHRQARPHGGFFYGAGDRLGFGDAAAKPTPSQVQAEGAVQGVVRSTILRPNI